MGARSRQAKAYGVIALVAVLALSFSATAAFGAPVKFSDADFRGYATGTVLHADAIQSGGTRLLDVQEAFTGSQVDTAGLKAIKNELDRPITAGAASKHSQGRGSGLDVGIATATDDAPSFSLDEVAEAIAPPNSALITNDLVDIPGDPLVYASVLRGQAQALWSDSQCILGRDISFGKGHAADVQLVNGGDTNEDGSFKLPLVSTDAQNTHNHQDRAVASSYSHEFMDVAKNNQGHAVGQGFGLSSEARMTIAPITLFKGMEQELTLEFAGEWVLRAEAGGLPGTARIVYGPGDTDAQIPLLRVIQGGEVSDIISLDNVLDALGQGEGIDIDASPLAHITIGEQPREIGKPFGTDPPVADDGTSASAAVDVVKIQLLDPDDLTHVVDLRIGHMEVKTQVPKGGIDCGIPVTKSAAPRGVTVNQAFVVTIKIDNPFGCDLSHVKVVDTITTTGDAKFQVLATNPDADTVPQGSNLDSGTIIWNDIGSIPKGGSKSVTTTIRAQGGGGVIKDIATASAVLANCEGEGEGNNIVGKSLPLQVPVVLKLKLPPTGVGTSATTILGALALLSLAGVAIRQMRRHA